MLKKILLFIFLFLTISIFACFLTQVQIFNKVVSADFDDGASWQCQFQNIQLKQKSNYRCFLWYDGIFQYGEYNTNTGWLASWFQKNNISNEDRQFYLWADVIQTFPLTINCAFHPFEIVDEKNSTVIE